MSAIPLDGPTVPRAVAQPGGRSLGADAVTALDVAWVIFVLAMLAVMWHSHEGMTIPYHFIFVTFALVYGFRVWPKGVALAALAAMTVATGLVFIHALAAKEVSLDEMAEIPLMPAIVAFMVWHALRGASARREVEQLAAREASRLDRQREFLRDTSHAIRTPVTIARGHLQLMKLNLIDPEDVSDTDEVLHQLDRINQLAGRLLTIEQLETTPSVDRQVVDVQECIATAGRRWSTAVSRRWVVDAADAGLALVDEHRLDEALDALVENALRFTANDDTIRLSSFADGPWAVIEVADSGPGIPLEDRSQVFDRFFHRHPRGEEPGSGLGLALVAAVAGAHGGDAVALDAPEGGALIRIRLPLTATADDEPRAEVAATDR